MLLVPPISAESCRAWGNVHVEQMETASPGGMQGTKAGPQDKALFFKATRECPQGSAHPSPPINNLCPTVSVMGWRHTEPCLNLEKSPPYPSYAQPHHRNSLNTLTLHFAVDTSIIFF